MFLFELTITACFMYHIYDKCLSKRSVNKRSDRRLTCRTHKYIVVETPTTLENETLQDAKTLQYFFNKLRLNKEIKDIYKKDDEITKKMFNKKKNINRKLTKRVKQLEKENKELKKNIEELRLKFTNSYFIPDIPNGEVEV